MRAWYVYLHMSNMRSQYVGLRYAYSLVPRLSFSRFSTVLFTCTRKLISSKGGRDPWDGLITCGRWWRVYRCNVRYSTLFATAAKIQLPFRYAHQRDLAITARVTSKSLSAFHVFHSHRKANQSRLTMIVDLLLNSWFCSYPRANIAWAMKCQNARTSQIRHYIGPVVSAGGQHSRSGGSPPVWV